MSILNDNKKSFERASPVDRHVGKRLQLARKIAGLSDVEIAKRLGITPQMLAKHELGISRLSAAQLFELSNALNIPTVWFFEGMVNSPATHRTLLRTAEAAELVSLFSNIVDKGKRKQILNDVRKAATKCKDAAG